ncbi:MAG: HPF/RaiA family ribosome-associated protein [Bacteroidota bacterium]|nr:HPF/RaiA family ribosome-associated protein [Bacteroidota bacterium]
MTIQINTDKNLSVHEAFKDQLDGLISEELSRFSEYITRLEVHLSDENGNKQGPEDKQCIIEARLEGRQPIAVTDKANDYELAVSGAIKKLKASLDKIIGKSKHHQSNKY